MATTRNRTAAPSAPAPTPADPHTARRVATVARRAEMREVDALSMLQSLKADLEAVSAKLNGFDPDALDAAARDRWSQEMDRVDLAIARTRSALLHALTQAFEAELPEIQARTGQLAQTLARLNQVAQVIDAVAGILGVIERIITLAK